MDINAIHPSIAAIYLGGVDGEPSERGRRSSETVRRREMVVENEGEEVSAHVERVLMQDLGEYPSKKTEEGMTEHETITVPPSYMDSLRIESQRQRRPAPSPRTTSLLPTLFQKFLSTLSDHRKTITKTLSTPINLHRFIKCLLAFYINFILVWVTSLRLQVSQLLLLSVVGVMFYHPGRTIGAQLEALVMGLVGGGVGVGYTIFAYWVMREMKVYVDVEWWRGVVGMVCLVLPVGVFAGVRSWSPRLRLFCIQALITIALSLVRGYDQEAIQYDLLWEVFVCWLWSGSICLLINFLIWPESANYVLRTEMGRTAQSISDCLEWTGGKFLQSEARNNKGGDVTPNPLDGLRGLVPKLEALTAEAVHELSFGYYSREEIREFVCGFRLLTRHLEGMEIGVVYFRGDDGEVEASGGDKKVMEKGKDHQEQPRGWTSGDVVGSESLREFITALEPSLEELIGACKKDLERMKEFLAYPKTIKKAKLVWEEEVDVELGQQEQQQQRQSTSIESGIAVKTALDKFITTSKTATNKLSFLPSLISSPHHHGTDTETETEREREREREPSSSKTRYTPPPYTDRTYTLCFFVFSLIRFGETLITIQKLMSQMERDRRFRIYFPVSRSLWRSNTSPGGGSSGRGWEIETTKPNPTQKHTLHIIQSTLTNPHIRFGIRNMVAVFVVSLWGYLNKTREWYLGMQMYWVLFTVVVLINPTLGATYPAAFYRIVGTIVGAVWGFVSWVIAPGNSYVISVLLVPFAMACWYVMLFTPYSYAGLVGLITHTIVIFEYPTYVPNPAERSIFSYALARFLAVTVGSIVAVLASWLVFPILARRLSRERVSGVCRDLAGVYEVEVGWLVGEIEVKRDFEGENTMVVVEVPGGEKERDGLSTAGVQTETTHRLHHVLQTLRSTLIPQATKEPDLVPGFDEPSYREIVKRLQRILDVVGAMRDVGERWWGEEMSHTTHPHHDPQHHHYRRRWHGTISILRKVRHERKELVSSLTTTLHILAGCLGALTPVPAYLPCASAARRKLQGALHGCLREEQMGPTDYNNNNNTPTKAWAHGRVYVYAYALGNALVVKEVEALVGVVEGICGRERVIFVGGNYQNLRSDSRSEGGG